MTPPDDTTQTTDESPPDEGQTERGTSGEVARPGDSLVVEAPERSRVDKAIAVRVLGAEAGELVDLSAELVDDDGVTWRSVATFEADDRGIVDPGRQAPESGSYEGVAQMGWCWSMAADDPDQRVTALMTPEDRTVTLRASAGERHAARTITRTVGADATRHPVDHEALVGTAFVPDDGGPQPGVLVLHGSDGRPAEFRAALLADHGFAAVAVRYVGPEPGISEDLERIPLSYFDDVADWLRGQPTVTDGQLGVLGHSWGALAALLLGSRRDWVGVVVSYSGSGVVWDTPSGAPAWVDDGEPVACISGRGEATLCEGQFDHADEEDLRAATIPVERIDGPVLLVSGAEDPIWPCRRLSELAAERLRDADHEWPFAHLTYDDASHFITPPYLPKRSPGLAGTAAGLARADADAWPRAVSYLRSGLDDRPTDERRLER